MTKKICRNCSEKIFYTANVNAGGTFDGTLLPIGFLHGPKYTIRICGNCGLTDWYVPLYLLEIVREKLELEK